MPRKQSDDSFSEQEIARRLEATLQGAFMGPPTALKDIPKRDGKRRSTGKPSHRRLRRPRKTRAA